MSEQGRDSVGLKPKRVGQGQGQGQGQLGNKRFSRRVVRDVLSTNVVTERVCVANWKLQQSLKFTVCFTSLPFSPTFHFHPPSTLTQLMFAGSTEAEQLVSGVVHCCYARGDTPVRPQRGDIRQRGQKAASLWRRGTYYNYNFPFILCRQKKASSPCCLPFRRNRK